MKQIILLLLSIFIMVSCNRKEYKYKILGKIYIPTSGLNPMHDAIWYTNTINFDGDTIYYFNSDSTKVIIRPPYTLIDNSK